MNCRVYFESGWNTGTFAVRGGGVTKIVFVFLLPVPRCCVCVVLEEEKFSARDFLTISHAEKHTYR